MASDLATGHRQGIIAVVATGAMGRRGSTRTRLIEAALAELDEKGFSALRVDDVARRAGLTSGAIYGTFATKYDLVVAALAQRHAEAVTHACSPRRRSRHDDETLAAALAVLDEKGYRAARVTDIAQRVGVTREDLLARFPTKHHLLVAAMASKDPEAFRAACARAGDHAAGGHDGAMPTADRLLAATLSVLDERGYRGATLGEIARRAGLTTGAIYANYESKEALLNAALGQRYETLFRSALDEVEDARASGGLQGALASILTGDRAVEHRAVMEVLAAASRDEPVRPNVEKLLARRHQVVASLLDSGKESGALAQDVPTEALAYVVQLLALGNVVGQAVGLRRPDAVEVQRVLARLGAGLGPDRRPRE